MAKHKRFIEFPIPVEVPKVLAMPGTAWVYTTNNPIYPDFQRYYERLENFRKDGVFNEDSIVYEHHAYEHTMPLQQWEKRMGRKRTPHFQGMIVFSKPKSFNEVRMLFPRSFIERAKTSFRANWLYINKECDSQGYGCIREGMLSRPVLDREN